MRYKVCLTVIPIFLFLFVNAQNKGTTDIQKSNNTFLHGTKLFCCVYRKTKYRLFLKGNEIDITAIYNGESTIKGVIKNSKIYSNDPMEKNNKMLAGKVYVLKNHTFRILTSEGGEYDEFTECK
jgi:hypothetical protein